MTEQYIEDELLDAIRVAAEHFDGRLTTEKYKRYRRNNNTDLPVYRTILYNFDSWADACKNAGVDYHEQPDVGSIDKQDIVDDIKAVNDQLDKQVALSDYKRHGKYSDHVVREKFDTWDNARNEAGIVSARVGRNKGDWNKKAREIVSVLETVEQARDMIEQLEGNDIVQQSEATNQRKTVVRVLNRIESKIMKNYRATLQHVANIKEQQENNDVNDMTKLHEYMDEHRCITKDKLTELAPDKADDILDNLVGITMHSGSSCNEPGEDMHIPVRDIKDVVRYGKPLD